jgi:uncharacterized protein (TIGR04551 family)
MSANLFARFQEVRPVVRLFDREKRPRLGGGLLAASLAVGLALPGLGHAQVGPGGGPGPAGQVGGEEEKPEGVAEKAPAEAGQLPTSPYLPPWPGEKKKAFQLLELDGYFRLRTDWFDDFDLGLQDLGSGTPFPEPLSCLEGSPKNGGDCENDVGSANIRLRLEPTINLSEKVSVHFQVDLLDNVVLGSTSEAAPTRGDVPLGALTDNQETAADGVHVKRAWGEVTLPLGMLKFGRMPSHWGLGVFSNGGGTDPFHETTCLDCDGGDTVDRVYVSAEIPSTGLQGAIALDWASSEPTSGQLGRVDLQPYDLDDSDDVRQWVFVVSDMKSAAEWKEAVDAGELAINWGVHLTYRKQDWDVRDDQDSGTSAQTGYVKRDAYTYVPDAYFRLGYGKVNVEAQVVGAIGNISSTGDIDADPDTLGVQAVAPSLDILQFGGVVRVNALFVDDDLDLGFEVGFASGDDWDADRQGETHYTKVPALPRNNTDDTLSGFLFDPNYHVDLILFRELLGTVRNATYLKPSIAYKLTGRVTFKAAAIASFANNSVSTPGNGSVWGVELDGDLGYHNEREGFFAGISYGALFPLSAMDRLNPDLGYIDSDASGRSELGDAKTAQTVQMRLALKF